MHLIKKMLFLPLFFVIFACADSPTAPTSKLSIDPASAVMRVGDSQNFVVSGGVGNDFSFNASECRPAISGGDLCTVHSRFYGLVRLEKMGPREAKLTILSRNAYNASFFINVSSDKRDDTYAKIEVPWP